MKMKLLIFFILPFTTGQRSSYIQTIVNQIKSSPRHKSVSPSFNGERKYEVIGTGKLPLQSDVDISEIGSVFRDINNLDKASSINNGRADRIARLDTSSEDIINNKAATVEKDSSLFFSDDNAMLTQLKSQDIATEQEYNEEQLVDLGSQSISRPSFRRKFHNKPRRRNPNNALHIPPNIRNLVSGFLTKNKRRRKQKKRPPTNLDYDNENNELGHVEKEEFSGFEDYQQNKVPGRKTAQTSREQMYKRHKRHKRKPGSNPHKANNPFKILPVRRPLTHRNTNKNVKFRPPTKIFNGFEPYFKGSLSYNEAQRDQDRGRPESEDTHSLNLSHRKRPPRYRPGRPSRQRPTISDGAKNYPQAEESPTFGQQQLDDSNPLGADYPNKPLSIAPPKGNIPERFIADKPQRQRPAQYDNSHILPFSEEIPSFGPEQVKHIGFTPDRPKRQRPHTITNEREQETFGLNLPGNSYREPIFKDATNDNMGFFKDAQENFPEIEAFGIGWDSQKVRRKREALRNPIYYAHQRRRPRRGQRPRQPTRHASRRKGPGGFWDDADFDAEFFNGGSPKAFNPFNVFPQQDKNPFKNQFSTPIERPKGQRTVRKPNSKPKNSHKKYTSDRYSTSAGNSFQSIEDNSILGSGNFEILKGGTFYEEDDYHRPYSNKRPAQPYKYYGNNDIFHNFRDFADIKEDNRQNGYQEGFYYR